MDIQSVINTGVNQFVTSLTKSLKPNEAAAIAQIVQGIVALIEAEAVNRGGPALLADLSAKFPAVATVLNSIPQVAALLSPAA
jgi:hypothetical protein